MENYKIFRYINNLCFFILIAVIAFYFFNWIPQDFFMISISIIAALATFIGWYATKPIGEEDVSIAVDKVLLEYESKTYQKLKEKKEEEQKISDFIEKKSNEIFLLKIKSFMEAEIIRKYNNSELPKMINELELIEKELDSIDVKYNEIELPHRLKTIIKDLDRQDQIEMYINMLDAFPFFPSKNFMKAYIKLMDKFFLKLKNKN